jgi:hypothetical protein
LEVECEVDSEEEPAIQQRKLKRKLDDIHDKLDLVQKDDELSENSEAKCAGFVKFYEVLQVCIGCVIEFNTSKIM